MSISSLTLVIASRLRLVWCISSNEENDDIRFLSLDKKKFHHRMYFILHVLTTYQEVKNGSLLYCVSLGIFSLDLKIFPFVTFDYVMRWCINVRYFKSVSYGHGKIRSKGTILWKQVNTNIIDMRAKERVSFGLHLLLVFTSQNHLSRRSLKWFRILVIVRMDWVWDFSGIE